MNNDSLELPDTLNLSLVVVSDFAPWHFAVLEALKASGKPYWVIKHSEELSRVYSKYSDGTGFRVYTTIEDLEEVRALCWETESRNGPWSLD